MCTLPAVRNVLNINIHNTMPSSSGAWLVAYAMAAHMIDKMMVPCSISQVLNERPNCQNAFFGAALKPNDSMRCASARRARAKNFEIFDPQKSTFCCSKGAFCCSKRAIVTLGLTSPPTIVTLLRLENLSIATNPVTSPPPPPSIVRVTCFVRLLL